MTILRKCPRCGSGDVSRSHRKRLEHLLVGIKPYRCNSCQRRFFIFLPAEHIHHLLPQKGSRKPL